MGMLPGEKATHVWKMVNPSEADAWPKGVYAKSVGGDDFVIQTRQWNPSAIVEPKATVDIVVDAIAPEKPGRYIHFRGRLGVVLGSMGVCSGSFQGHSGIVRDL